MSLWNRVLLLNKICVQASEAVYQSFSSWPSIIGRHCFCVCVFHVSKAQTLNTVVMSLLYPQWDQNKLGLAMLCVQSIMSPKCSHRECIFIHFDVNSVYNNKRWHGFISSLAEWG